MNLFNLVSFRFTKLVLVNFKLHSLFQKITKKQKKKRGIRIDFSQKCNNYCENEKNDEGTSKKRKRKKKKM